MTPEENAWHIIGQFHGHPLNPDTFKGLDFLGKFQLKRAAIITVGIVIASCPSQPVTDESMPNTSAVLYWQQTLQMLTNIQM
jgi:hypothetical protein